MKHTYNGNHEREFPSLGLTLKPGDTFEAPEDFNAHKAFEIAPVGMREYWFGHENDGMVEWMGDCPKGPGGHPLELGHQRIAKKINEHIRNLGWLS